MNDFSEKPVVRAYLADVSPFNASASLFEARLPEIPAERRERLLKYRFQKDKSLSLGAGLLLKGACEDFSVPGEDRYLSAGDHGKPCFSRFPGLFFNLSHAGTKVFLVMGTVPCGLDTEKLQERALRISKRFLTPSERREYEAVPDVLSEKEDYFFRLWTGKESLMKCTGLGFALPLSAFSLHVGEDGIRLLTPIDEHSYRFFEYAREPEYRYTICLRDYDGEKPEMCEVCFSE